MHFLSKRKIFTNIFIVSRSNDNSTFYNLKFRVDPIQFGDKVHEKCHLHVSDQTFLESFGTLSEVRRMKCIFIVLKARYLFLLLDGYWNKVLQWEGTAGRRSVQLWKENQNGFGFKLWHRVEKGLEKLLSIWHLYKLATNGKNWKDSYQSWKPF